MTTKTLIMAPQWTAPARTLAPHTQPVVKAPIVCGGPVIVGEVQWAEITGELCRENAALRERLARAEAALTAQFTSLDARIAAGSRARVYVRTNGPAATTRGEMATPDRV